MNWTEAQLADHLARLASGKPSTAVPLHQPNARFALGRLKTGEMNKTESAYAAHLEMLKIAGEVLWYRFEGIKLRLADNTFLTVDFAVMEANGILAMHEVKGHWENDARVKIKVAAAQYPFRFIAVKKDGAGWKTEEF